METIYLQGNTMRITAEFRDFANVLANPTTLDFTVYTNSFTLVSTESLNLVDTKVSEGVYQHDYVMDALDYNKVYIIEMKGVINDKPSLNRKAITVKFVEI